MFCKICGKHLYEKIDFYNLFRWKYEIHQSCQIYLEYEVIDDVIPISSKMVHFMCVFEKNIELNEEYVLLNYGKKLYEKISENTSWSIIFFNDNHLFLEMESIDLYLLLNLCDKDLIVISLYCEV